MIPGMSGVGGGGLAVSPSSGANGNKTGDVFGPNIDFGTSGGGFDTKTLVIGAVAVLGVVWLLSR